MVATRAGRIGVEVGQELDRHRHGQVVAFRTTAATGRVDCNRAAAEEDLAGSELDLGHRVKNKDNKDSKDDKDRSLVSLLSLRSSPLIRI